MDEIELIRINYVDNAINNEMNLLKRLETIHEWIKYIDKFLNNKVNQANRKYINFTLKKKRELLKMAIELTMNIIFNKHC